MLIELMVMTILSVTPTEWSQFRGPTSDGHALGPATPMEWSETKNVSWKTSVPGLGWSSPVVGGGKVFLTTAVPKGEGLSLRAMAFDAKSGKLVWDREVRFLDKAPAIHTKNSHASPTPILRNEEVFVHFGPHGMAPGPDRFAAYDLSNGEELWRVLAPGWSVVPQPAIGHGMVFYNRHYDDPEVMAVKLGGTGDVTDSHVAWRIKRGAPSTPSPLLVGDELYFVSDKGIVSCVDAKTGERHWMERLEGNYSASPVFAHGRLLFLNETGVATWVKASKTFERLGTNELPGSTLATPAFLDGAMYLRTDTTLYKFAN